MLRKISSITGLIILAVIILTLNLIADMMFSRVRVDLTEEGLYSLSDGSINILGDLDDDLTAKLYYSKTMIDESAPGLKLYAKRVIDMLREYEAVSGGKFSLEMIDPRPDTEEEEGAIRYGIQAIRISNIDTVFFGLVILDESGNEEKIAFLDRNRAEFLEYDLTKAVYSISNQDKKKIGVITSLPIFGSAPPNPMMRQPPQQQSRPWFIIQQMRANYELEEIQSSATELPSDIDLLMLVHPKGLDNNLEYAIDQFVLKGGNVIAFVDPFNFTELRASAGNPQQMMQVSISSNLPTLMKAWGVELEGASAAPASPPGMPPRGGGSNKVIADPDLSGQAPMISLVLREQQRNANEIISAELDNLQLAFAGALKKLEDIDGRTFTSLLHTSDKAALVEDMMLKFGAFQNNEQLQEMYNKAGEKSSYNLAWKISGKFKTAFPDKKSEAGHLSDSTEDSTVVVVGDVDIINDMFCVQFINTPSGQIPMLSNDNIALLLNSVEHLTGSQDLIALRSRGKFERPFTKMHEIENQAREKWQAEQEAVNKEYADARKRLQELQNNKDRALTSALIAERKKLNERVAEMGKKKREISRNLREDKEKLESNLMLYNLGLVPGVLLLGLAFLLLNPMRRRTA